MVENDATSGSPLKAGHYIAIQGVQLLLLVAFLWTLHRQEMTVIGAISPEPRPQLETFFIAYLDSLFFSFLPDQLWRQFWPFALISFAFLFLKRARWYFLAVTGFLTSVLLISDQIFFGFFSTLISVSNLSVLHQLWDVKSSVFSFWEHQYWIYLLVFSALGGWGYLVGRKGWTKIGFKQIVFEKSLAAVLGLAALYAGFIAFYIPTSDLRISPGGQIIRRDQSPVSFSPLYRTSNISSAATFGVSNYHIKDLTQNLIGGWFRKDPTPEELGMVARLLDRKKELNDRSSPVQGIGKDRNVILICLEAFQHFLIDLEIDGKALTPNLNAMSRDGFYWNYIFDNIGTGGSSDAEFSVMTGLFSDRRGLASAGHLSKNQFLALPSELKKHGYHALSMHGNDASFWFRDANHPLLGFDEMYFKPVYADLAKFGLGVSDKAFFEKSLEILKQQQEPFFSYLISLSSHHPYYDAPSPYGEMNFGLPQYSIPNQYLQMAAYTDYALGQFIAQLKASPLGRRSLIVIYGDHIAPMKVEERSLLGSSLGIQPGSLREMRVPLIILAPGQEEIIQTEREAFVDVVGGLYDIFPTILHLLGLEAPLGLTGVHLFLPEQDRLPASLSRRPGVYFHNGVLFDADGEPMRDQHGPLFRELEQPLSEEARRQAYKDAMVDIFLHEHLFDFNSQYLVRKQRGLEP